MLNTDQLLKQDIVYDALGKAPKLKLIDLGTKKDFIVANLKKATQFLKKSILLDQYYGCNMGLNKNGELDLVTLAGTIEIGTPDIFLIEDPIVDYATSKDGYRGTARKILGYYYKRWQSEYEDFIKLNSLKINQKLEFDHNLVMFTPKAYIDWILGQYGLPQNQIAPNNYIDIKMVSVDYLKYETDYFIKNILANPYLTKIINDKQMIKLILTVLQDKAVLNKDTRLLLNMIKPNIKQCNQQTISKYKNVLQSIN